MRNNSTTLSIILFLWFNLIVSANGNESVNESAVGNVADFFDVSFGDFQEELALVDEENKTGILVMFETEDCPWCARMKQQVLNRIKVQNYFRQHFRILSVDAEGDVPIIDFQGNEISAKEFALKTLRVRATPVFVFFGQQGELITRYTGALKNAHDFLLLGRFVVEGHHQTGRFNQFRRANQPS